MALGGYANSGYHASEVYKEHHSKVSVYPTLAVGVTVTTHADDWVLGGYAEIVPVDTITTAFHIHQVAITSASANGEYEIVLYCGTTEIGRFSFSRTDKKDDVEGIKVATPECVANSQIQVKLASENDSSEDTAKIKIWYHEQ